MFDQMSPLDRQRHEEDRQRRQREIDERTDVTTDDKITQPLVEEDEPERRKVPEC